MTAPAAPPTPIDLAAFRAQLREALDDIRADSVASERDHRMLHDRVRQVLSYGFGSLRVPRELGGAGASFSDVIATVIELAEADSNLAHVFRGHVAHVETLLLGEHAELARWTPRFLAGELVGNAQAERAATADISTAITRDEHGARLNGTKFYTTGSIYADWIYLTALDGDEHAGVTVSSRAPGVQSVDDWDGVGQQLTGSGTTTFTDVPLDAGDITRLAAEDGFRSRFLSSLFQLYLLAVVAGIAQAIVRDTVDFVVPRRRIFGYAGEMLPRDDALVQSVVGDLAAAAHTARTLVLASAGDVDRVLAARAAGDDVEQQIVEVQLNVYKAQQVVLRTVVAEASELFEVGGATAVTRSAALDRHWRNVRTIASHNPAIQRRRAIGDYALNGRAPERARTAAK